ncbi:MAG: sporulation integral membrane protein YtvI [Lachnospiraceae bacterium]
MSNGENKTAVHYTRVLLNILIPAGGTLLVCIVLPKFLRFFMPFVVGWIIAMIANPLVRFLESRLKVVRKHGSVLVVITVLALIIGALYLLLSKLLSEASGLLQSLPQLWETFQTEVRNIGRQLDNLFAFLPDQLGVQMRAAADNLDSYIGVLLQNVATPTVEAAGSVAKSLPSILVNTVVIILSSYFFIAERDTILNLWKQYMPENSKKHMSYMRRDAIRLIGGYFMAQFRIMFVVAAILTVGFLVLQVPYSFLLALLISLLDFLPVFGTGTVLIPWGVIKLLSGEYYMAGGLILLYILSQFIRQAIQPKIVGDSMGLPPLMTLVFLYIGFKVSGLGGMILAVPVGLVFLNLYKYGIYDSMIDNLKIFVHDIEEFRKKREEDQTNGE